jgi:hypothetical protein
MPHSVDTRVHPDQSSAMHPRPDLGLGQADREELVAANHPVRGLSQPCEFLLNRPVLLSHIDS